MSLSVAGLHTEVFRWIVKAARLADIITLPFFSHLYRSSRCRADFQTHAPGCHHNHSALIVMTRTGEVCVPNSRTRALIRR